MSSGERLDSVFASTTVQHAHAAPVRLLSNRELCDYELLASGGFSPLTSYLSEHDYASVLGTNRLSSGSPWTVPIVLPVDREMADAAREAGNVLHLADSEGCILADLRDVGVFQASLLKEVETLTEGPWDPAHPYTQLAIELLRKLGQYEAGEDGSTDYTVLYAHGTLHPRAPVRHDDFVDERFTPATLLARVCEMAGGKVTPVVGFQTRNPMHRCHVALAQRAQAAAGEGAVLVVNPVVGPTQPGDIDEATRVRCYRKVMKRLEGPALLAVLPLAMRMLGPREAVWHAIIRRNHGCTHFAVGRDHAGPSRKRSVGPNAGQPFYGPYDAHALFDSFAPGELGITIVRSEALAYSPSRDAYVSTDELAPGEETLGLSGTELRRRLASGEDIPGWFAYPEVVAELRRSAAVLQKGAVVYCFGIPASGKSTLARRLAAYVRERSGRHVTLLDADVCRTWDICKGLGFSEEGRRTNVRRIGFVASMLAAAGDVVIVANIAPYADARAENRRAVTGRGGAYVEVFLDTPVSVCAERDPKGLYAAHAAGTLGHALTGVDDRFDRPTAECPSEVVLTPDVPARDAMRRIARTLRDRGCEVEAV